MPEPVFVKFARAREELKLSISSAAEVLGIGSGFLFELEEFKKVVRPGYLTTRKEPIAFAVARFFSKHANPEMKVSRDREQVWSELSADFVFHSLLSPVFQHIFVFTHLSIIEPRPVYYKFFLSFIFFCLLGMEEFKEKETEMLLASHEIPIYPPSNKDIAATIDYLWRRRFEKATMRRRLTRIQDIKYSPTGNISNVDSPMGYLYGKDSLVLALSSSEGLERYPYFAYLLLYAYILDYVISPLPSYVHSEGIPEEWLTLAEQNVVLKLEEKGFSKLPPWRLALCLDTPKGPITVFFPFSLTGPYASPQVFWVVRGNYISALLRKSEASLP
jgi:hypothetical protein